MKPSETLPPASYFVGHMRHGVVILDHPIPLPEGQPVRIEPLAPQASVDEARADQLRRMHTLFAQWDEEDSKLSDEEADRLRIALQQNRGLSFRTAQLD